MTSSAFLLFNSSFSSQKHRPGRCDVICFLSFQLSRLLPLNKNLTRQLWQKMSNKEVSCSTSSKIINSWGRKKEQIHSPRKFHKTLNVNASEVSASDNFHFPDANFPKEASSILSVIGKQGSNWAPRLVSLHFEVFLGFRTLHGGNDLRCARSKHYNLWTVSLSEFYRKKLDSTLSVKR